MRAGKLVTNSEEDYDIQYSKIDDDSLYLDTVNTLENLHFTNTP